MGEIKEPSLLEHLAEMLNYVLSLYFSRCDFSYRRDGENLALTNCLMCVLFCRNAAQDSDEKAVVNGA